MQKYGGISRYYARTIEHIGLRGHRAKVFAPINQNSYLRDLSRGEVFGVTLDGLPKGSGRVVRTINGIVNQISIAAWKPDVLHRTYFEEGRRAPNGVPTVTTVYDMIHELYPTAFGAGDRTAELKRQAVWQADHVLCISQSTKDDLIRLTGLPAEKATVVYLGAEDWPLESLTASHGERPYLLFVGSRAGYKNFSGLLKAYALSPRLRKDFDIVAFGSHDFDASEYDMVSDLGVDHANVRHLRGDDQRLRQVYRGAKAFIYPSLYEGFGLPPLEAMTQNCPVITGRVSSIPEVAGTAAEYFDPNQPEDISRAIESVVYSDGRSGELINLGRNRIAEFSWQRCADETLSVYGRLL
ncbi:glycosyltransferase family 1 protein [Devosia sp.]